jgi:tetratricopeptide (TPR) repeat protein
MPYLFLLFFIAVIYANSLHNQFLMDDYPMLIGNRQIDSLSFLQLSGGDGQIYFRPMTHFLNYVTYAFFGENPVGYHVVNIILVYFAGVVLFRLLREVLEHKELAFLVTLFFYAHPINGVLMNYKNATGFPFMILAANLSLWNHWRAVQGKERSHYILGLIWLLIALLCHEMILVFPLYLFAVLFFSQKLNLRESLRACLPAAVVVFMYFIFRVYYINLHQVPAQVSAASMTLSSYLAALAKLIFWYIKKLLFLDGIVLMWDTPPVREYALSWCLSLAAFFGTAIYFISKYRSHRNLSLGLFFILIGILPVLAGCLSRPWFGLIIEPHWMIYSSIGFFILVASLFIYLKKHVPKWFFIALLTTLLCVYGASSRFYNYLWADQIRYCQYWQNISSYNFMPKFWLAYAYVEKGRYKEAETILEALLEKKLKIEWVYGNLGIVKFHLKKYDEASYYLFEVLKKDPNNADANYFLGVTKFHQNDLLAARIFLNKAYSLDKTLISAKEYLNQIGVKLQSK